MTWCIYALFSNNKEQIQQNYLLKTINHTTNLAYSLDGYLWAISALAAERLQIRCVMEPRVYYHLAPTTDCGYWQWMRGLLN